MLSVTKATTKARKQIPSAIHVDGTSRVQLVWKEPVTAFRRLIETFDAMTDIPVLINTSFNRKGEPIVETPADALNTFFWSGLDYLVMSNFLICKDTTA
jgi:carbamoyltransferase